MGLPEQPDLCTVQADTRVQVAEKGEAGSLGAWELVDGVYKSGDRRTGPYAEKDTYRGPTEPAEKPLTTVAKREHSKCPWGMLPWLGHL